MQIWKVVLIFSVLLAVSGLGFAHSGATGIVKERMELMKSIAEQMKTIGKMIKGEENFNAQLVVNAAEMIADHAEKVPDMFPEGSVGAPSEALPAIWQDWQTFLQLSSDLKKSASELSLVAESVADVSGIRPQFAAVGKTCSGCHEDFRKEN